MLVGIPGLRAGDLSPTGTPELWRLLTTGASGSLSVRAVRRSTCPADGWLTLNAGARTGGPTGRGCPFPSVVATGDGGARVDGLAGAREDFGAVFGTLAASAGRVGCVAAVGPGAALALADAAGRVERYATEVDAPSCPLTVVDLGALPGSGPRAEALRRADDALARLTGRLPPGATVVVAGLADDDTTARLHVAIAAGPRFGAGRLDAPSTRQPGLVQLTDLTPTLLDLIGAAPATPMVGSVIHGVPAHDAPLDRLRGPAVAADVQRDALVPFFTGLAAALLLFTGLALRTRHARLRPVAVALACVPAATFLVNLCPWWTLTAPALGLAALVAGAVLALWAAATFGPWDAPGFVALATAALLAADAITGSRLQQSTLYGQSPLIAGRFYGFGNSTFAVFAVASLLGAATLAAGRRRPWIAVAAVGSAAVAVDGWPGWGTDVGGVLALVPAFALLGLWVSGVRVTLRRAATAALGGVAVLTVVALVDWLRPAPARSHLGAFVQQVLDGRAGTVLARKATTNLHTFTDNPLALLVPVALAVVVVWLARPTPMLVEAAATLRPGLAACVVAAALGLTVNDSGATVPAMAMTLAVPLTIALLIPAAANAPPTPGPRARIARPDAVAPPDPAR